MQLDPEAWNPAFGDLFEIWAGDSNDIVYGVNSVQGDRVDLLVRLASAATGAETQPSFQPMEV